MILLLKSISRASEKFFIFRREAATRTEASARWEFLFPSTPFLPAPPERFGILRNARGVSLKKGSRIFNYSPHQKIQPTGWIF